MPEPFDVALDDVSSDALSGLLTTYRFGRRYEAHAVVDSTNDLVGLRAREGAEEGLVVLAEEQTGGRGQKGRRWHSAPGRNLTFSLLLRPPCPITGLPPLTLLAGVAVAETLAAEGFSVRLKWPNDLLVDTAAGPAKLGGILTEMATLGDRIKHVVIGIGLNVNQTAFDEEATGKAQSLARLRGAPLARAPLLAALLAALEARYDQALAEGNAAALARWRAFAGLPRACRVERGGATLVGTAVDVDGDGALLVRDPSDPKGQLQRVLSGEISPE